MSTYGVVDQFLESLETDRQLASNTISAYHNDLYQLTRFLDNAANGSSAVHLSDWSELSTGHLVAFSEFLQEQGYAQATVARKTAAVKSFVGWLNDRGIVDASMIERLPSPRVNRYHPQAINRESLRMLLAAPMRIGGQRPEALRDRAMLELLVATGMRVGEMVAIDIDRVDVRRREVSGVGKTGRERTVSIADSAMAALMDNLVNARSVLASPQERALFVNRRGRRLTRQGLWLILGSYAEAVGIERVTPHTLRHTYAIHAIQEGVPLHAVQQTLGHVSQSTTAAYIDLAEESKPAAR